MVINIFRAVAFSFLVFLLLVFVFSFEARAGPESFGVYGDSGCNEYLSYLDWGEVAPGQSVSRSFFVKNLDETRLSALSFTLQNVVPESAENYFRLEGSPSAVNLAENGVAEVDLTLYVDPLIHDVYSFEFDVVVAASFSESSDFSSNPSGSGEVSSHDFEDTVTVPSEDEELTSNQKFILVVVVVVCGYLIFGGKR